MNTFSHPYVGTIWRKEIVTIQEKDNKTTPEDIKVSKQT